MFKHILVCCDGSETALDTAQTAVTFAQRWPCRITLLYVLDLHDILPPFLNVWEGAVGPREVAYYQQKARTNVEEPIAKIFRRADLTYQWRFAVGHPVAKITEIATETEADLILMGSRGLGAWRRFLLGSVSEGVLHHASCSVLIVRGENAPCGSSGFRQILFASDGSESAEHAGQIAVETAHNFGASLDVLNIVEIFRPGSVVTDADYLFMTTTDPAAVARHALKRVHDDLDTALAATGISCTFHQEQGGAGDSILHFADKHASDLIVMGSRGLGGFERMLLGSVSLKVVRHANCPVLIVR